jgi:hypothetical protein
VAEQGGAHMALNATFSGRKRLRSRSDYARDCG